MRVKSFNYDYIVPIVIKAMFPDNKAQKKVKRRLDDYGKEDWHIEPNQVRLAILRITYDQPEHFSQIVETACGDYRDILYFAETQLSIQDWDLPEENPKKYEELVNQNKSNYLKWICELVKSDESSNCGLTN